MGAGDAHSDASVFENLSRFVERGGRVLVVGYDSVASPTDPLLIQFLGATGSTDVPPAPGPITTDANSLTLGVVDLRGVTPMPTSSDRDTLTGLAPDTIEVVGTAGGGGAQWTLRRLGAGEIAYVSSGDSGASANPSWTDPSSAYHGAIRNFAASARPFARFVVNPSPIPSRPHPRRAHTTNLLEADRPAVLVGPDRAWVPEAASTPLALCGPERCRPVRAMEHCAAPRCPGAGYLVIAIERVAEVGDYPAGRDAWTRETESLLADAELATLRASFGSHPEPTHPGAPRFSGRDELTVEGAVHGGAAFLTESGDGLSVVSASLGVRWTPPLDDEVVPVLLGSTVGLDARVTVLPGVTGQRLDDVGVLVGIAPALSFALDGVRIPPAWAWVIPEVGGAFRPDRAPAFYATWSLAGAFLLHPHLAIEMRASGTVIDAWTAGGGFEALLALSLGVVLR